MRMLDVCLRVHKLLGEQEMRPQRNLVGGGREKAQWSRKRSFLGDSLGGEKGMRLVGRRRMCWCGALCPGPSVFQLQVTSGLSDRECGREGSGDHSTNKTSDATLSLDFIIRIRETLEILGSTWPGWLFRKVRLMAL